MNNPIKESLNNDSNLYILSECIEDVLRAPRASKEKPYKIFKHINENWSQDYDNLPSEWKNIMDDLFL